MGYGLRKKPVEEILLISQNVYTRGRTIRASDVTSKIMAGASHVDDSQFKGLSKYFNSTTSTGRANVAKATYASLGLLILYFTLKPKKQPTAK